MKACVDFPGVHDQFPGVDICGVEVRRTFAEDAIECPSPRGLAA